MVLERRIIDTDLEMEDGAAAITSDGAGSAILDLGSATQKTNFDVIIFVSALDATTGDEGAVISVELSTSATFASTITSVGSIVVRAGATSPTISGNEDVVDAAGDRFVIRGSNEQGGTLYRYARLWFNVSGTTPSITCKAWMSKRGD